jgi:hypothetical protein
MYTKLANQNEVSADERDRLILEHLPQVKLIASRIHDKLPSSVVLDDLVSAHDECEVEDVRRAQDSWRDSRQFTKP